MERDAAGSNLHPPSSPEATRFIVAGVPLYVVERMRLSGSGPEAEIDALHRVAEGLKEVAESLKYMSSQWAAKAIVARELSPARVWLWVVIAAREKMDRMLPSGLSAAEVLESAVKLLESQEKNSNYRAVRLKPPLIQRRSRQWLIAGLRGDFFLVDIGRDWAKVSKLGRDKHTEAIARMQGR